MKARELERLARRHGWHFLREAKGSHTVFTHPARSGTVYISYHGSKDIPIGTLKNTLKIIRGEKP